jgi:hypothetical protein
MTAQEARALAIAHELHSLLGEICDRPEHGVGTCVEAAWDRMDEVLWLLDPDAPAEQPTVPGVRLAQAGRLRL